MQRTDCDFCQQYHDCRAPHSIESHPVVQSPKSARSHANVTTTQIYTHVLNKPGLSVRSPLDS